MSKIPATQCAVQLVGPDQLRLNREKPVYKPTDHQILAKVEAMGLCFSDLKLLHQFSEHARKGEIVSGIDGAILDEYPAYQPGDKPTVPGHECVCRIIEIGSKVKKHKVGDRCIVQSDWRKILTAASNGAFGYNFEGALQEYILFDERIVIEPGTGDKYLIPVDSECNAAAAALVEPWACVECSYVNVERQTPKAGGRMLVVVDAGRKVKGLAEAMTAGKPAMIDAIGVSAVEGLSVNPLCCCGELASEAYDDIVYFGTKAETIEKLNDALARNGIINIVLGGGKIDREVEVGVGRLHYGLTRWIGTAGDNAADSYKIIPANGEVKAGNSVIVIGAGGPMGQMHVIRALCLGFNVRVVGTDFDDGRLAALSAKANPLAAKNGCEFEAVNTGKTPVEAGFDYYSIMAPVGALVADAIVHAKPGALINIFAGIPAPVKQVLDLNAYISKGLFMFGTSGSLIGDMIIVRDKMESGLLDTGCSLDAVSGIAGAIDGIEAVKNRTMAGKIVVYPELSNMPLIPLNKLAEKYPTVAAKLKHGMWTTEAEKELLKVAK
ncbi:MAG TPA: alcohol dehydrogenase catalytic domain-containing protein [Phycisphaerae bacterium]|nr:alcohol dehydrogenase catalytic domain-containing protein [Phycisphaerae bacterium]